MDSTAGPRIDRALLSVSEKLGLVDFARGLAAAGVELFSTGGTRRHLEASGLKVQDISAYTGFPEMMEGRLKTLHPKVHGGILCRYDRPEDMELLRRHGILTFPLVVVNLYPFETVVARGDATFDEAIENIDIGGPTLIRAAAKNHAFTTVATEPAQYAAILDAIRAQGGTTPALRRELAASAFSLTARYDAAIADYFDRIGEPSLLPPALRIRLVRHAVLRYGENPHQQAALYVTPHVSGGPAIGDPSRKGPTLAAARQLGGKELSYNNLLDLDSALAIVASLPAAAAVVIKHNNPCGAASAETLAAAARAALAGDPVSAFGSVVGLNRPVDAATAEALTEPGTFIEAIVAPRFEQAALSILTTRPKWKDNVRLLEVGQLDSAPPELETRHIAGGLLLQQSDRLPDPEDQWQVVTKARPTDAQLADLRVAWALVRHVNSNAIVLVRDGALCGTGAGQMSRVDSVEIALGKAGPRAAGAVLASDAFFPFADSIQRAAAAGVAAVIQPGGSRRDEEVIAACDEHSLLMIFTGRRHFKH